MNSVAPSRRPERLQPPPSAPASAASAARAAGSVCTAGRGRSVGQLQQRRRARQLLAPVAELRARAPRPRSQPRCQAAKSAYWTGSSRQRRAARPRRRRRTARPARARSTPSDQPSDDDVVHREQQHVLVRRASRSSAARSSGPRARSKGARCLRVAIRAASASAAPPGSPRRSYASRRNARRRRRDHLHRLAVHLARTSCAAPRGGARSRRSARSSAAASSAPAQPQAQPGCCRRAARVASWSRNQSRCCANESGSGRSAARPASIGGGARRPRRRACHRARRGPPRVGRSNSAAQRQLDAERAAAAREIDLRRQQRVPAQLEEVVVGRPTRSRPSTSAQIPASACFGRRPRRASYVRAVRSARPRARAAPCGRPCRWA